jgi:DNA repair exonuclease SbcCD ATPase subunit
MSQFSDLRRKHRQVGAEFMAAQQRYYELKAAVCYVEREMQALRRKLERLERQIREERV